MHVRSFSNTTQPSTTTALWVHQQLAAAAQQQASSSSCSSSSLGSAAENQAHHAHDNNNNNNINDDADDDDIAAVLQLRRVEACDAATPKTAEGRRHRKEQAIHTVEEDLGVNAKTLQMEHIQSLLVRGCSAATTIDDNNAPPMTNSTTFMTGAILQKASGPKFTKTPLERTTPRSNKNATTTTAAHITSLQRLQPLLPAVPLEICVPRNGGGGNSAAALDQEATQGAANLLLLLSKAVSSY